MNTLKKIKKRIIKIWSDSYPTLDELIERGLIVGKNFNMQARVVIDYSHCYKVKIGDNVTIAPDVTILAHDTSTYNKIGYTKIGLVTIGNDVFIGAKSIILPNVIVGNNVIIGAGSVVTKNIPDNSIVAGNPAKIIGNTEEYIVLNKKKLENSPVYGQEYSFKNKNFNTEMKKEIIESLKEGKTGYLK